MSMDLEDIEPALFVLKEELENWNVTLDSYEMRVIEIEKLNRKINANIAVIFNRLTDTEERLAAIESVFARAVNE